MKIGIIKETKEPQDNRVALTPEEIVKLQNIYPDTHFVVQKSNVRVYSDEEYVKLGIPVVDSVSDCDILFGIKEADISTLLPKKHYFFFGHIAKMQPYNRPLLQQMIRLGITFSDYEYLVNEKGERVCAFGWWAGVVGVYNTLRAYGLKYNLFQLEKPDTKFTLDILFKRLEKLHLPAIKIVLTGSGRVSHGAVYALKKMGIKEVSVETYLREDLQEACFCVAGLEQLVQKKQQNGDIFDREDFQKNPHCYQSNFGRFYRVSDILISCHFWAPDDPIYLSEDDLVNPINRIKVIGDITCDIQGSIKSTLRSSTHADPFYDYNPITQAEEKAFSNINNITVMAVDTLPNALAIDTSRYFGEMLSEHVFPLILKNQLNAPLIKRATILEKGQLTEPYSYLKSYAEL